MTLLLEYSTSCCILIWLGKTSIQTVNTAQIGAMCQDIAPIKNELKHNKGNDMAKNTVDRKTIYTLSQETGIPQPTIRAAVKTHPLFQVEGAVEDREIEGSAHPPMKWLKLDVFEAWRKDRATKERTYTPRAGGTRFIVRLEPNQVDAVAALLTPLGVVLERAAKPKAKPAEAGNNGTADEPTPLEMSYSSADLVSA